jgi:hypothetical protein
VLGALHPSRKSQRLDFPNFNRKIENYLRAVRC